MGRASNLVVTLLGAAILASVTISCAPSAASSAPGQIPVAQQSATTDGYTKVTAPDLAKMLQRKDFLFVNVHVPYQGEIEGTDLFLPYDQIEASTGKLPADKAAKIVLYCRSGAMSTIAARTLVRLGYTNVSELTSGMGAWQDAGYSLVDKAR